jgi:uncharacterized protein (TIGR02246 family)
MSDFLDEAVLRPVLDAWRQAINAHEPAEVAELFTEDAVFQGLQPYAVGPAAVEKYYAGQPAGMTAGYRVLKATRLGDDVVLGWVAADFTIGAEIRRVNLTVVVRRTGSGWRIAHYHVSPRL